MNLSTSHYLERAGSIIFKLARLGRRAWLLIVRARDALVSGLGHADPFLGWLLFTGVSVFAFFLLCFFGIVQNMIATDRSYISLVILILYVATSVHCMWRALDVSREAEAASHTARLVKDGHPGALPTGAIGNHIRDLRAKSRMQGGGRVDQSLLLRVLAERLRGSNDFGGFASDSLMKIGLFGTIVGFIMMLAPMAGLDTENQTAVKSSMGLMSEGMAVAMYTTLAGLVASILIKIQYHLVEAATSRTFTSAVALTEVYVIAALERQADRDA